MTNCVRNPERLFGTSGVRGVVDNELTQLMLHKLGKAIGSSLATWQRAVIATDTRISRERVKSPLIAGLLDCGVNVVDLGVLPTPVLAWATIELGADLGIMVTASHNPPEYNGVKLFNSDGIGYSRQQEQKIEHIYALNYFRGGCAGSLIQQTDTKEEYYRYLSGYFQGSLRKKFKVVVDPGNGAASLFASGLFSKLGLKVFPINDTPDGTFPGRSPEPREDTLIETYNYLKQKEADLAVCFDGDADRVVFIDKDGFIGFNESIAFKADLSVKYSGKKTVAATVETGMLLDKALSPRGVEVLRGRVGDVAVAELARDSAAAIGVEPVGVYIMPEAGLYPNSLLAALTLMDNIDDVAEIRDFSRRVPRLFLQQRKFPCLNSMKIPVMQNVFQDRFLFMIGKVNDLDGLRLESENKWMLIRPSGTEPMIRLIVESTSDLETTRLIDKASGILENLIGGAK